jgi:2,3,4,5-tetrahydropyridine-2-carboxylate N-succinyltransferase
VSAPPGPALTPEQVRGATSAEDVSALRAEIESLTAGSGQPDPDRAREVVRRFLRALSAGQARAAERTDTGWRAVEWVKRGILLAFRVGVTRQYQPHPTAPNPDFGGSTFLFFDKDTIPLRHTRGEEQNVRIVPGGTSVREGAYLGPNVIVMPPAFVNVGAWVDEGTMVDSHALVGSCAQIGKRVHLSAGAQIGGVLEPVGARPVIVEDDVMVGGNVGIFEGTLVERRCVLAPGVQLTRSTAVYDLVKGQVLRSSAERPLAIPEGAVVVPGARPAKGAFAAEHGVQLYAPVIVKYRDSSTDAATALEDALR